MLTLEEASNRILARVGPTDAELVPLSEGLGRVLVDPLVVAEMDVPPFANSAMDGFAVRVAETPGDLRLAGEVAAGSAEPPALEPCTAIRIMTGAPIPQGADAVVPLEEASESAEAIRVPGQAPMGAHIRAAGHDTPAGTEVCLAGRLTPAQLGVLASLGIGSLNVRRRPRVAVVSSGDELTAPGARLDAGRIYDANTDALAAAVSEAGGEPLIGQRLPDDAVAVERALREAATDADLVVTSGGVSVGRHDHVRAVIERHGSLDLWRIAVQPGKPLAVGELGGKTIIGLPGNPVSALITFELFVRPAIRAMLSLTGDGRLRVRATPEARMPKDPARRAFLRVRVWYEDGWVWARAAGGQGSAQLRALAEANALLIVPEGQQAAEPMLTYDTILLEAITLAALE